MNTFFEKTSIRTILVLYVAANIFNYIIGLGLMQIFRFEKEVGGEVARALVFAIITAWFIYAFIKHKVSIGAEVKKVKGDINIKEVGAVIILNYGISLAIVLGLLLVIAKLLPPEMMNGLTSAAAAPTSFAGTLIGLITASLLAPIAEELLFRGVLFTQLKKRMSIGSAMFISSVLFGLTHISLAMPRSAIFGACMCILFLKTKNIIVPIVAHMVYNFLLTIIGSYKVLLGVQATTTSLTLDTTTTLMQIAASIIVIIVSALYLSRRFAFFNLKQYKLEGRRSHA